MLGRGCVLNSIFNRILSQLSNLNDMGFEFNSTAKFGTKLTQVGQYGKETVSSGNFMKAVFRAGKSSDVSGQIPVLSSENQSVPKFGIIVQKSMIYSLNMF